MYMYVYVTMSKANSAVAYVNNHTAVWGSWYDLPTGLWGYACCHSCVHLSYCTGRAGIEATKASTAQSLLSGQSVTKRTETSQNASASKVEQNFAKKRVGEGDVLLDQEKFKQALDDARKRKTTVEGGDERSGKKRRGVLESSSHDVTEEEFGLSFSPML
jgi:pre-mRNA-processing factor SLU7